MTSAFKEGWGMKVSDMQASPTFTELEEILDPPTIGTTAELIEVTNHQSNGYKEYIAGLKDGDEFTVQCNRVQGATVQNQLRGNAKNGDTVNTQIYISDGVTLETFEVAVVVTGAQLIPGTSEQNKISFTFKISGEIGGDW